jgi:hypothetical protein
LITFWEARVWTSILMLPMPFWIFTFSYCVFSWFFLHTFLKQIRRTLVRVRSVGLGRHNPFESILSPKTFVSVIRWYLELMPDRAILLNPISPFVMF